MAVLRFFEEVYKDSIANEPVNNLDKSTSSVEALRFDISDNIKQQVLKAEERLKSQSKEMKMFLKQSNVVNRDFPKKNKISPDGVMQMSIQLAYRKLTGGVASTYEAANTSAFKHGRTETVRYLSTDSIYPIKNVDVCVFC